MWPFRVSRRGLRQFGDDLRELFHRPGADGMAAYKAQAAVGQCVFGNVVAVRRLDDLHQIVFAGGEIDLLDFATAFLGKILRRLRAFGVIFDFANALLGEVQGHNEQHGRSPMGLLCHSAVGASVKAGEGTRWGNNHFRFWPLADIPKLSINVRFRG
jgi:hypothetical protein